MYLSKEHPRQRDNSPPRQMGNSPPNKKMYKQKNMKAACRSQLVKPMKN